MEQHQSDCIAGLQGRSSKDERQHSASWIGWTISRGDGEMHFGLLVDSARKQKRSASGSLHHLFSLELLRRCERVACIGQFSYMVGSADSKKNMRPFDTYTAPTAPPEDSMASANAPRPLSLLRPTIESRPVAWWCRVP
jgi:hypothetical protein